MSPFPIVPVRSRSRSFPFVPERSRSFPFVPVRSRSLYEVHQQPVSELRLEPGRFRRHDAALVRNRHEIRQAHGIHRERDRGLVAPYQALELIGPTNPTDKINPLVRGIRGTDELE